MENSRKMVAKSARCRDPACATASDWLMEAGDLEEVRATTRPSYCDSLFGFSLSNKNNTEISATTVCPVLAAPFCSEKGVPREKELPPVKSPAHDRVARNRHPKLASALRRFRLSVVSRRSAS